MALSKVPTPTPVNTQELPKARDDLYRSAVVDEEYNSQLGLENLSAGYTEEVTYFNQILGEHDESSAQQLERDEAGQQYLRIQKMPVKIQGSMSPMFNADNRRFEQQGTVVMPALVKPHEGDTFLLTGLDHRVAVYNIVRFIPKNISLAPAWECEVQFQSFLTEERLADLESKIQEDTFYDQDQLKHGKHPVMATIKYNRKYDYLRKADELCQVYYKSFYNRELNTVLVPGQHVAVYDPWAARAFRRISESIHERTARNYMLLNVDDSQQADAKSVWELVMERNSLMEAELTVTFGIVHYKEFFPYPQAGGIRFSGVKGVVWPVVGFQSMYDLQPSPEWVPTNPFVKPAVPDNPDAVRMFPLVTEDEYYVFTEAFYANTGPMTVIESMVRQLIDESPVSHPLLLQLVQLLPTLGILERYYFTPFVIMLLQAGALEP